ncbi:T3SS effector protein NleE, partial [Escherichia coli]
MISPIKNIKNVFPINTANTEYIVRNIYPRVEHGYFNESPNIYGKKYISGIT